LSGYALADRVPSFFNHRPGAIVADLDPDKRNARQEPVVLSAGEVVRVREAVSSRKRLDSASRKLKFPVGLEESRR
jgi:hypothetical protein